VVASQDQTASQDRECERFDGEQSPFMSRHVDFSLLPTT
jgi:hypothetical protein